MVDHQVNGPEGPYSYSCKNSQFWTNVEKGVAHSPHSETRGSVLEASLSESDNCSLWLEHVSVKDSDEEMYWLMWYDSNGMPTISGSAVFSRENLESMVGRLTRFVP